jgi:hypothetical protein
MAQTAVRIALPKLQALGVTTRRPDDYFAEMAKSDEHMQKVFLIFHVSIHAFVLGAFAFTRKQSWP